MGVEPYALAGALALVLAQRLVRLLCPACSRPAREDETGGIPESARAGARVPVGCEACLGTAYRGRTLLAEKLPASEALHDAIMAKAPRRRFLDIAHLDQEDLESLAWQRVAEGLTSSEEVRRVLAGGTV
jgi:type II secretory ATPase GspE/PulE/Tfp pilus assembly ATPase PilB-like protein